MNTINLVLLLIALTVASALKLHPRHCPATATRTKKYGVKPLFSSVGVDDKQEVTQYFDNEGFNRWNKIYSESGEVNKVQLDIRTGHQQTIDKVLQWLSNEDNSKKTVCDAGCGVGSLALPMSSMFKKVFASDISTSMTKEAAARAKKSNIKNVEFKVSDMEALTGKYDTLTCIDVFIHYPTDKVSD